MEKRVIYRRTFIKKSLAGTAGILLVSQVPGELAVNRSENSNTPDKKSKQLAIKEIIVNGSLTIDQSVQLLEKNASLQHINIINWPSFPYKPDVKFRIAYCQDTILLKYYISEQSIVAKIIKVNDNVHFDSCVEFFISISSDATYYNFEFNCIGTPHVEYGQKGKRIQMDPEIIRLIKVKSSLGNLPFAEKKGAYQWELMLMIPKACFCFDKNLVFKGLNASANFYKCGDHTSVPHYLTWNPIGTKNPDYHQPSYFGSLKFK